jgi:hypothetical protein
MVVCDCPDAKRGNLCKHVVKAYMYIKGSSLSIPSTFPHMDPPIKETLLPTLSLALILNCNNLEGECSVAQVDEGDEEENLNLIDEHTKQLALTYFSKVIDHCILMK